MVLWELAQIYLPAYKKLAVYAAEPDTVSQINSIDKSKFSAEYKIKLYRSGASFPYLYRVEEGNFKLNAEDQKIINDGACGMDDFCDKLSLTPEEYLNKVGIDMGEHYDNKRDAAIDVSNWGPPLRDA